MSDAIEQAKQLSRKWREETWRYDARANHNRVADELDSLIPSLEAEIAALRERTIERIRPWLLHDDECAKLTNDDGVKCTCGLDESVCALVKGG